MPPGASPCGEMARAKTVTPSRALSLLNFFLLLRPHRDLQCRRFDLNGRATSLQLPGKLFNRGCACFRTQQFEVVLGPRFTRTCRLLSFCHHSISSPKGRAFYMAPGPVLSFNR